MLVFIFTFLLGLIHFLASNQFNFFWSRVIQMALQIPSTFFIQYLYWSSKISWKLPNFPRQQVWYYHNMIYWFQGNNQFCCLAGRLSLLKLLSNTTEKQIFKNSNTAITYWMHSKLQQKYHREFKWCRYGAFVVNFEDTQHIIVSTFNVFGRSLYILDTVSTLNLHKTFGRRLGCFRNVLCTFSLRLVSRGDLFVCLLAIFLKKSH